MSATTAVGRIFADAGVRGWLHARAVHDPSIELGLDADRSVPLVSVYKLVVLVAYARAVDDGALDPRARTTLSTPQRTGGSTGISIMSDPVTLSWRDAVTSMVAASDNAAADAVFAKIGPARIAATLAELGLPATRVTGSSRTEVEDLLRDTATSTPQDAYAALRDLDRSLEPSGYDPLRTSSSTPREITTLLSALWSDTAATPEQCAFARHLLALRSGPYRLQHGFAMDGIRLADKTGTFGALRHDVGVVQFPGEAPYAVAVFTRAARPDEILPEVDAAIGAAARVAVDQLRWSRR